MEAFVYQNNSEKKKDNHFVKVKLKGENQNSFGVGSVVELFSGKEILRQELIPSRGFQSSIDYVMTFGIGTKKIDSLQVIWPNGKFQILKKIEKIKFLLNVEETILMETVMKIFLLVEPKVFLEKFTLIKEIVIIV